MTIMVRKKCNISYMDKYKVGDILVLKEDKKRMFRVVQINEADKFPIKTREMPYVGVRIDFEIKHADKDLINLGSDLSKVLYE